MIGLMAQGQPPAAPAGKTAGRVDQFFKLGKDIDFRVGGGNATACPG